MASINVELEPLPVTQYVYLKSPPGLRQDGMKEKPKVALSTLSRETLLQLLEEHKATTLSAWEQSQRPKAY